MQGATMRSAAWGVFGVWVAMATACGRDEVPPPTRTSITPETVRPREQSYAERLDAVRRLLKDGETVAAVKAARELLDDHRLDAEGLVVIATAYQVAGDAKEALKVARTATQKDPSYAPGWIAVGAAERTTGGFQAAEAALKRALELDPASRAARFNLAGIAADQGHNESARKQLQELVEADPDDFETRFLLASTLLAMKELGPAKAQLADIVARYPQHFKAQKSLAAIAWAEGNYKKAFQRAAIAARLNGDDAEVSRLLEGSFYIVAAAKLTCVAGARPWPSDKIVSVLTALEKDEGLEGAASFVELDERLGNDPTVQQRVARAAADAGCATPTRAGADAGSAAPDAAATAPDAGGEGTGGATDAAP